jgi:hypothetical protein
MLTNLAKKVFGSRNDRLLKQYRKTVAKINAREAEIQALSDEALQAKTAEFKQRLANGATLESMLEEAFAVCREASRRVLGMRHFDVQLIGGMVLHEGKIAEMRTGEGKTLVATLPVYLNALVGKGVHVVTVNDYLAGRDAGIMEPLYNFLGLSVGVIVSEMEPFFRQSAYNADITYGTNNEFGFDYLRDNMVTDQYDKVQRALTFAVVDEVDSILIDEARTPLIISGQADDNVQLYQVMNTVPAMLVRQETEEGEGDYWVDEKAHTVLLSESGHERAEEILVQMGLLKEGDSLVGVAKTGGCHDIMLFSNLGKAIRFNEYWEGSSEAEESEDDQEIDADSGEEGDAAESSAPKANKGVRPSGRGSGGLRGMRLPDDGRIVSLITFAPECEAQEGLQVLTATENGYGKRTPIGDYSRKGKGGQGNIAINTGERNGDLVAATLVAESDDLMLITSGGVLIRTKVEQIRETGRAAAGVRLINLDEGETLVSLERVAEPEETIPESEEETEISTQIEALMPENEDEL